jgi:large subunit ribosomal protein L3
MKNPPEELKKVYKRSVSQKDNIKTIEENLENISKIRVLAITQPKKAGLSKKKPEITEIEIDGKKLLEKLKYAKDLLGKLVSPLDVFNEGMYVDVLAVTKGKGFQGPVKRWGVRILQHKARKTKRGIATLGPWKPAHVMYSVPRAGQMGFHQRTERNKRILKIGTDGREVTPKGGFINYGIVNCPYILVKGSIPGSEKRPVKLRYPSRPPKFISQESIKVLYISLDSPQGK